MGVNRKLINFIWMVIFLLNNSILQFHGCHYHGHGCSLDKDKHQEKLIITEEITESLITKGYKVIEKCSCEFNEDMRTNKDFDKFNKKL